MSLKIVRNDITRMRTQAIVNTANARPIVGPGCDMAIYRAAGYEQLLAYRQEKIGTVAEGEAFITPGFDLPADYIIHAVSPLYRDGGQGEEEKLRSCYRRSLALARDNKIRSVAFPLISTGSFGYPKEEGLRIAVDEINAFLLGQPMEVYLVVFDEKSTSLGERLYPKLEAYIDRNYVEEMRTEEYGASMPLPSMAPAAGRPARAGAAPRAKRPRNAAPQMAEKEESFWKASCEEAEIFHKEAFPDFEQEYLSGLQERMRHAADTFSEYLLFLIRDKKMENADVYKRAIVDKKVFSKIKNNPDYHPQKLTALCLCVGAMLNLDESKDLLARAGYALSPCDKTDIIFSYFIENGIYDMIELDIQLEEHGLPCIIT